ncbi:MAG: aminodeoxychorismate/anthranilate synthase component II [Prevotella sp.]|uniref:Aminodeoxychorismate/anthranilate synthase component II n=1 Tax=Hallella faecis TaxID=2841596 RepID=A0ABV1FSV1_9BACT|nr:MULTISPECIES: aminodeoxychorismate/anthranilate synthase component II [Hallella]MBU0290731.1 aminodeoxychorismate/anthranilate synthase component II [Hallella faecis]MCI7434432.1 aminodeoxychorismate/anthranilate synthase component II [Prevotella sp.]MDD7145286.1 aminodeoxychorismate/anthranilate synthase component II [Hallella sp.]
MADDPHTNNPLSGERVVIIDNYDSFTYNLAHLVKQLGAKVEVFRNDQFTLNQLERFTKIILSPGPGIPEEAGLLMDVIRTYAGRKPMLGVCLGHQAIAEVFGGKLVNLKEVYHGIATEGTQFGNDPIFSGLPKRIVMGRYHSWVVDRAGFPDCLEVTAMSDDGQIMALRHRNYNIHGIQFHPESVLTPEGATIVRNWLQQ